MPDIRVDIPGVGPVDFPDSMSSDEINAASKRLYDNAQSGPDNASATPEQIMAFHRRDTGVTSDAPPSTWKGDLAQALDSAANPQTVGDIAGLLIPGQIEGAVRTGKLYLGALQQGYRNRPSGVGGLLSVPARAYAALRDAMPSRMAQAVETFTGGKVPTPAPSAPRILTGGDVWDRALQDARSTRATPPPTAASPVPRPAAAPSGLSAVERTALQKQGYPADLIAKIDAAARESDAVPVASHTAAEAAPVTEAARVPAQPALQGPRIRTGAERVGREAGMTKEAVRQATGPVLDEAVGDASPILPKNVLGRMIDDLKAMPPGSPEREAYVARATSGKTKWQVENIRRTLEHLGLIVPAAAGLDAMRGELLQRMRSRALDQ